MTVYSVAEARSLQDAHKSRWSAIVREAILDTLRGHSTFHADDLEPLGIPDEHRAVIGSQVAKLVNQFWVEEIERRKSKLPSRNAAKSGVYQLTPLGRMKLAGVGGGNVGEQAAQGTPASGDSPHSGESMAGGRGEQGTGGTTLAANATPGPASPEPSRLFEPEPPKPLHPLTDRNAA